MRRVLSVVLLFLGGWLLASEAMIASVDFGQRGLVHLGVAGLMLAFALPFLLLGMWASPGNRLADIGITMMIAVGIGAMLAIVIAMMTHDPGFKQFVPRGRPLVIFNLAIGSGLLNLAVLGGLGFLAWRTGEARAKG